MTGHLWLSMLICPIMLFVIGALVERFLLRKVHSGGHVHELLLTFGLAYILGESVKWVGAIIPCPSPSVISLREHWQPVGVTISSIACSCC